jgi:hypothetical protein
VSSSHVSPSKSMLVNAFKLEVKNEVITLNILAACHKRHQNDGVAVFERCVHAL